MIDILIKNGTLITLAGGVRSGRDVNLGIIEKWAIGVKDGKIVCVGDCPDEAEDIFDAEGKAIFPGFIDPHTHAVFGGQRSNEFAMRLQGKSYMEIRAMGGGINASVSATRKASSDELRSILINRLEEMKNWGVLTVEVKSGYGLNRETELKMLQVINDVKDRFDVLPTFLGAHDIPHGRSKDEYIEEVIQMIPEISEKKLARFIDVFCEEGVFTPDESRRILLEGKKHGLIPKIHADEIKSSGGAEVAGEVGAISADHLLKPSDDGLKKMKSAGTIAVFLPACSFYLGSDRPPVDKFRDMGIPIAIGTDFNPGSSPVIHLTLAASIGCIHYGLTIEEAIAGITINAARSLGIGKNKGSLEIGKVADIIISRYTDYRELLYWIGANPVYRIIKGGKWIERK